jgi:hypothetical protein
MRTGIFPIVKMLLISLKSHINGKHHLMSVSKMNNYSIQELGLKLVEYAYAREYTDLGDWGDLDEFKEKIIQEIYSVFKDDLHELMVDKKNE